MRKWRRPVFEEETNNEGGKKLWADVTRKTPLVPYLCTVPWPITDFSCSRAGQFLINLDSAWTYKAPSQAQPSLHSASRSLLTPWKLNKPVYKHSPEI